MRKEKGEDISLLDGNFLALSHCLKEMKGGFHSLPEVRDTHCRSVGRRKKLGQVKIDDVEARQSDTNWPHLGT